MSFTFDVNEKAKRSLGSNLWHTYPTVNMAVEARINKQGKKSDKEIIVEAAACNAPDVVAYSFSHPMIEAAHLAFDQHYPLVLTPDSVWLCIAQGFANHVNSNAELLRKRFVAHEGKKMLVIDRLWAKGDPNNDWEGAFAEFSDKLSEHIGKKRDLVVSNFSTTTAIEKAASEVVLMDSMKSYFKYAVRTLCGIPSVTLEGTVDDWKSIKTRVQALSEFELSWWTETLLPITDELIAAASGNPDVNFWDSLYKPQGGSGGPYVTGWINTLFPYIEDYRGNLVKNQFSDQGFDSGPTPSAYQAGLSKVPFKWQHLATMYDMEFLGGFVGTHQDKTSLAIRPAIGWAIRHVADLGPGQLDEKEDW